MTDILSLKHLFFPTFCGHKLVWLIYMRIYENCDTSIKVDSYHKIYRFCMCKIILVRKKIASHCFLNYFNYLMNFLNHVSCHAMMCLWCRIALCLLHLCVHVIGCQSCDVTDISRSRKLCISEVNGFSFRWVTDYYEISTWSCFVHPGRRQGDTSD